MSAEMLRRAANLMREMNRQDLTREAQTLVAVADLLDREATGWEGDYDTHWIGTARAWDRANDFPMGEDVHGHFQRTAVEYADGRHRPALNVARAYLGEA